MPSLRIVYKAFQNKNTKRKEKRKNKERWDRDACDWQWHEDSGSMFWTLFKELANEHSLPFPIAVHFNSIFSLVTTQKKKHSNFPFCQRPKPSWTLETDFRKDSSRFWIGNQYVLFVYLMLNLHRLLQVKYFRWPDALAYGKQLKILFALNIDK